MGRLLPPSTATPSTVWLAHPGPDIGPSGGIFKNPVFDAFRVELASADGGGDKETLWVAKDSLKVVKVSAVLASMGGAVLTEELVQ